MLALVQKPLAFILQWRKRPHIITVSCLWMAAQGAHSPLWASWWAPELIVEKAWQHNQQPQWAASCCHFHQSVCLCVCVGAGLFCQNVSVAHRALHLLFSLPFTHMAPALNTQHARTHTATHILWSQRGPSAAISGLLSLVTAGSLCQDTHTHTHTPE